jgi:hypothetical protein
LWYKVNELKVITVPMHLMIALIMVCGMRGWIFSFGKSAFVESTALIVVRALARL